MTFRVLAIFLLTVPALAADPAAPFGRVELPLSEWQGTMDQLNKAEADLKSLTSEKQPPPYAAVVATASCEITFSDAQLRLTTDFEIEVLSDQWTTIPLADASLPLISTQSGEGRIVLQDGAYALLTNKPGKTKIRLVQETLKPKTDRADFWLAPATSLQARLAATEAGQHFSLNQLELTTTPLALPPLGKDKTLLHLERSAAVATTPEIAPGVWENRSETQITYEDGRLHYHARTVLLCTSGDDQMATLTLPGDGMILKVEGENLDKWESAKSAEARQLVLRWSQPGVRQRVVLIDFALAQPDVLAAWPLISPQSAAMSPSEIWQLQPLPGLRQKLPSAPPLTAALSSWMRARLAESDSPAFTAKAGTKIEIAPVKTIALAEANIESASFKSELAIGGGMLTNARFEIVASEKTEVALQLEKDARIISCRVNGERQMPVDLGDGRIQISIAAKKERAAIELSFSQQLAAFDPASGQIRLLMPQTPLLTKTATWSIYLPAGLSLSAFDGTLTADSAGNDGELRFHQELYRDTPPLAVLFYQKKIK